MTTYQQADAILQFKRNGYKHGTKSSNKKYDPNAMADNYPDPAKETRRNTNQALANAWIGQHRHLANNISRNAYGRLLVNNNQTTGNCFEMACIAASQVDALGEPSFIGGIAHPGDHAFCLAGQLNPGWTTVDEMSNAMDTDDPAGPWIIDPWMNICCNAANYANLAEAKLRKWTSEGKRIWWYDHWTAPSIQDYVDGFRLGPLSFRDANS